MGLRDIEATLPPGFRFYPSDEELVCHYLYQKITDDYNNNGSTKGTLMVEVDLHACEPWQLPDVAKLGENEWYFYSFRERKYSTGFRTNRATASGYWKATGKDKPVYDKRTNEIVGMRKTLVFYRDRAPNGIKTEWVMHEFRLENQHMPPKDWVLCRVFHKSKGDFSTQLGLENDIIFDVTSSYSPKLLASSSSSMDHQINIPFTSFSSSEISHFHQYESCSNIPNNSLLNLSSTTTFDNPNSLLEFITPEMNNNSNISIHMNNPRSTFDDHQYGFLYDDKFYEDNNFVD